MRITEQAQKKTYRMQFSKYISPSIEPVPTRQLLRTHYTSEWHFHCVGSSGVACLGPVPSGIQQCLHRPCVNATIIWRTFIRAVYDLLADVVARAFRCMPHGQQVAHCG
uniref:Uncharacterized protein n=1 Tax=Eutreptiella gymnastica TaxID=73025 RepID=A0A7S4D321_9EUGL